MTTIYDVARQAQVSAATVSRVLNGRATVDPVLVERVQEAVRSLGYRRNAVARNLRRSRTMLWGLIISDIGNPFFTALARGVEDVAQAEGYSVALCNSDENPAKESQYIGVVLDEQMAGVIISPSGRGRDVRLLIEANTPVVAIDRELRAATVDSVLVDNEHGAELATSHLIESGYRRIACITGPKQLSTATQRLRGYKRALAAAGLPMDESLVRYSDYREAGAFESMESLLDSETARPDAVFAANNLTTVGAMDCLVSRGVKVPGEVGFVGFDDIPWAHLVRPSLTTVAQPTYELGQTAARLLVERIKEPSRPPARVVLRTVLHERDSSRRP